MSVETVLITGANRGLGAAFVDLYLKRGWRVVGLVRDASSEGALRIKGCGAELIEADLREKETRTSVAQYFSDFRSRIDLLINNAGPPARTAALEEEADEETLEHFQVHCLGVLRVVQGAQKALRRAKSPLVVNISSRLGSIARMAEGMYSDIHRSFSYPVAKAAQNMLTAQLHRVLYPEGIRVIAVHPGALLTGYGSRDAATPVDEGAKRLAELFGRLEGASGVYLDPYGETIPW